MTTIVEPWYNGRFRRGIPILVNFDRSPEFDEWLSKSESRIIICLLTCPMITGTKFWSRSNESRTTDKSFETEVDTQTNGRRQHSQHNSSTNLCSQRSWNPGCYCFVSSVSVWQLELPSQPRCLYFPTFSVWSSTWLYWKFRQAAWRHIQQQAQPKIAAQMCDSSFHNINMLILNVRVRNLLKRVLSEESDVGLC